MRGIRPGIWGSSLQNKHQISAVLAGTRGPTNECDVNPSSGKRSALCGPTETVFEDPGIKIIFGILGQAKIRWSDTLQDIVVVLGCSEHAGRRVRNVPVPEWVRKWSQLGEANGNKREDGVGRPIHGRYLREADGESDVPSSVNIQCSQKSDQSVAHLSKNYIQSGVYLLFFFG